MTKNTPSSRVFVRLLGIPIGATVKFKNLPLLTSDNCWTKVGMVVYVDKDQKGRRLYTIQSIATYYIRYESEVEIIE